MANPTTSVTDYATLLGKSKLLPPDEVEALHRKWKDDYRGADDQVEAFGKFLVSKRVLTPYQAAMVQRGRADGFFLNGYKILDRIGKGQMGGGVYKSVHTLGQLVALKILPASRAKDQHTLGRFQREARLLTQLDHPNVVRAFQVGEADRVHYIVMEYLEGETLEDVLERRKRLPSPEAVRLICQALHGLQHLHERHMVHRDLKPSNLMLLPEAGSAKPDSTWDCTVKILDIGLGRELFSDETPEAQVETQLTVEGAVLGTPDYLAPEQARDARSSDIRADIYSLGCVLYHALTGRTPFPDSNIMAQMLKHATEKPQPLHTLIPDAPPGLQQTLDVMMAKDVAQRFQTPEEAAIALKPYLIRNQGTKAATTSLVPEYKRWLETESEMEMKVVLPPMTAPLKPGTGPAKPIATPPPPPKQQAPVKSGAANAMTLPLPVPVGLSAPVGLPANAPRTRAPKPADDDEVNVELVTLPQSAPASNQFPVGPPVIVRAPDERPLTEFHRRDMIMLGIGGFGVLTAFGLGFGLAQLIRKKPTDDEAKEEGK